MKGLKMDTSNSLLVSNIKHLSKAGALQEAIQLCKPLKYFGGFKKTLENYYRIEEGGEIWKVNSSCEIAFPSELSPTSKVFLLALLFRNEDNEVKEGVQLFLSMRGELILLNIEWKTSFVLSGKNYQNKVHDILLIKASFPSLDELDNLMHQYPELLSNCINEIWWQTNLDKRKKAEIANHASKVEDSLSNYKTQLFKNKSGV